MKFRHCTEEEHHWVILTSVHNILKFTFAEINIGLGKDNNSSYTFLEKLP